MTTGLQSQALMPPENNSESFETPASTERVDHFNMDIIPNTQIFFPPENLPVATNSPTAKITVKSKGIYCSDPKLDQNANELWRFLVSHLKSPSMYVRIEGTHNQVTNVCGRVYTSVVADFSMQIDVSKFVNPRWSRMVTHPFKNGVATPTVREILEEYARCRDTTKEFCLKKLVGWDFEELAEMLVDLVRLAGYHSQVTISYLVRGYKVVVAHSRAPTEMGILAWLMSGMLWPARSSASKRFRNRLVCEYSMDSSVRDFFFRESERISDAVRRRCKMEYMVALGPDTEFEGL